MRDINKKLLIGNNKSKKRRHNDNDNKVIYVKMPE